MASRRCNGAVSYTHLDVYKRQIYISADIFVERDSHKSIVIGAGGAQLKQLGAAAREQIEQLMDAKVFLELWVKVEPNWRRNPGLLRLFGYAAGSQ